jgi:hypothetical protein
MTPGNTEKVVGIQINAAYRLKRGTIGRSTERNRDMERDR